MRRARQWWSAPRIDGAQVAAALRQLGPPPQVLLVHSSLSGCGTVVGGPDTIIAALREWVGGGTLVMPTHSYCYPTPAGDAPIFDPKATSSVVGAITDAFWRQPGVRRSLHPTHSLAAEGPAADSLVRDHEKCGTPCGAGSPYERLAMIDASVLMLGVGLATYTLFHTAEDAAMVPYLYHAAPVSLRYRRPDGAVQVMSMRRQDTTVRRSFDAKTGWLEDRGLLTRVRLGAGELLYIRSARAVHEALVEQLRARPGFLLAETAI